MIENKKGIDIKVIVLIVVTIVLAIVLGIILKDKFMNKQDDSNINSNPNNNVISDSNPNNNATIDSNFNIDIIKQFNESAGEKNYLLSPYSIEIALNMLRDGALGNTKLELDKVLGNRVINNLNSDNKIVTANSVFIKDEFKNYVKSDYNNTIKSKYNSEIIYDSFNNTDTINEWANIKTNGMIKNIMDDFSPNAVMVLVNALALDVKWQNAFECNLTREEKFTKADNSVINVEMMHKTFDSGNYKYIKTNDLEGVVIPYEKIGPNIELEFIGLIPNTDINSYINNLTKEKLDELYKNQKSAGNSTHISVSLPRFTYDYNEEKFISVLNKLGIKDAFTHSANLSNIGDNLMVGQAIHKTHIDLNESGTKAAAVTAVEVVAKGGFIGDVEKIEVKFNKPFMYMIREKNTGEILFFGSVYEPNLWNGKTCQED